MAWCTSSQLLQWIADTLKVDEADLPTLWTRNAQAAVDSAYETLLKALAGTSYSGTQLSTSDQAENLNLQQGLFALAGFGGGFGEYKAEFFDRFNVAKDIMEQWKGGLFALTKDGDPIAPDLTSAVGGIRFGNAAGLPTIQQARCRFFRNDPWGRW